MGPVRGDGHLNHHGRGYRAVAIVTAFTDDDSDMYLPVAQACPANVLLMGAWRAEQETDLGYSPRMYFGQQASCESCPKARLDNCPYCLPAEG